MRTEMPGMRKAHVEYRRARVENRANREARREQKFTHQTHGCIYADLTEMETHTPTGYAGACADSMVMAGEVAYRDRAHRDTTMAGEPTRPLVAHN